MASFNFHGKGALSKVRKNGRRVFFARYFYQGRPTTEKLGLEPTWNEEKARAHAQSRRRAIDEDPSWVPPHIKRRTEKTKARKRITFAKFAEEFKAQHGATRRSEKTFFRPMADRLAREFGAIHLDAIATARLQKFIAGRARKVGAATVNQDIRFLKNMFGRAVAWGYLATNPANALKQLQEPPARELFLDQAETDKLIEVSPKHVRAVVQFALLTGMRRSELLGLTWPQIDLARRTIYLRCTKNGKARVLPIGDDLKALLESLPRHTTSDRVFTYRGRPIASLQGSWEGAREALVTGVRTAGDADRADTLAGLHFHDLRHTWASRMVMAGADLYTLMDLGGWSDLAMVKRYAHFAPEFRLKAAQLVNGTAAVKPATAKLVAGLVAGQCGSIESMSKEKQESARLHAVS